MIVLTWLLSACGSAATTASTAAPTQAAPVFVPATPAPIAPPPAPPVDRTAPNVAVKAGGKPSLAKGVPLVLTSNEAGTAKLTLTVDKATARKLKLDRKAEGAVIIGSAAPKLVKGSVKFTVKLNAKARKALKRVHRLKAKLTIVATDASGNSSTTTLALFLKN